MTLEQLADRTVELVMHMPARAERDTWAAILKRLTPQDRVELARYAWLSLVAYGYDSKGDRA